MHDKGRHTEEEVIILIQESRIMSFIVIIRCYAFGRQFVISNLIVLIA